MSLVLSACDGESVPHDYRDLAVPSDVLASDAARAEGRALFIEKCALCHGVRADGQGIRRAGLSGKPVNFRSKEWRQNATPRSVFAVISNGKRGTSMPGWPTLTVPQRWAVVAYVLSVSEEGR